MSEQTWNAVDTYIGNTVVRADAELVAAGDLARAAGLPDIAVAPNQGKLLHLIAVIREPSRILEIGTLGGYSTIWLARALGEGGSMVSLEYDAKHAEVARQNLAHAGVADRVEVRVGAALDTLPELAAEGGAPFDVAFIDADKVNNAAYFDWAVKLGRSGSVIVVDNVVRDGRVIDANSPDEAVQGTRRLYEAVGSDTRVGATVVQTVGSKGYDGFLLAVVR